MQRLALRIAELFPDPQATHSIPLMLPQHHTTVTLTQVRCVRVRVRVRWCVCVCVCVSCPDCQNIGRVRQLAVQLVLRDTVAPAIALHSGAKQLLTSLHVRSPASSASHQQSIVGGTHARAQGVGFPQFDLQTLVACGGGPGLSTLRCLLHYFERLALNGTVASIRSLSATLPCACACACACACVCVCCVCVVALRGWPDSARGQYHVQAPLPQQG
jgi:hypothetical protein